MTLGVLQKKPSDVLFIGCFCVFVLKILLSAGCLRSPRDPITETENGFMEPKYIAFC